MIDYHLGRKLNKSLIQKLASCEYISQYRNIFITGAAGSGKTYLASSFGMESCKRFYSVWFTRPMLLIIDEWLLFKHRENEARLLLEVVHKGRKMSSTIFCSQFEEKDRYNQICDGESPLALTWLLRFSILR